MPWYRAYIDKEITEKGGGDHSRFIDLEADNKKQAEQDLKLKKNEVLNQVVELSWGPDGR
jgi:hypothetical protein